MHFTRRQFAGGVLALPVLAQKKAPLRPNLVLIAVDELPAWVLGAYGNREIKTPNLDHLAETGTRFANHFACSPSPAISRATLFSGRTPMQLGASETPSDAAPAFAKMLTSAGYTALDSHLKGAAQLIAQQSAGKPFALIAGYPDLHPPYDGVGQKYTALYADAKFESLGLDRAASPAAQAGKEMLADIVAGVRKAAAAISAMDEYVGAVVAALRQKQLADGTLIVFTSTSGALLGRHGLWSGGAASDPVSFYDEAVATPMIWSWPGRVPAQAVRPEMIATYDFVPTLCDLLSVDAPAPNLCGRSYVLVATGKPLPKKQPWPTTVFGRYRNVDMARVEKYKLVLREQAKGELYDLARDRAERVNQFDNPQFMTVRKTLSDSLAAWKQRYSA